QKGWTGMDRLAGAYSRKGFFVAIPRRLGVQRYGQVWTRSRGTAGGLKMMGDEETHLKPPLPPIIKTPPPPVNAALIVKLRGPGDWLADERLKMLSRPDQ